MKENEYKPIIYIRVGLDSLIFSSCPTAVSFAYVLRHIVCSSVRVLKDFHPGKVLVKFWILSHWRCAPNWNETKPHNGICI